MVANRGIIYRCVIYFKDNISDPLEYTKVEGLSKTDYKLVIDERVVRHSVYLTDIDKVLVEKDTGVGVLYKCPISRSYQYRVFDGYNGITDDLLDKIDRLSRI